MIPIDQLPAQLDAINPDDLRRQLLELDRQQSAIRILLRAVLARQRKSVAEERLDKERAKNVQAPAR
jgi:hypothetical protein